VSYDHPRSPLKEFVGMPVILGLVVMYASGMVGCSVSEWIEVKCPEQHTATRIPRDAASTYHYYGSMYESGYRATEAALESMIPKLPTNDTLKIVASDFKRYLVGEHSAVQMQLEKAVAGLQDNPCDDEARTNFQFLIQYVNFNGNYLKRIASACNDTSSNLRTMLGEYRRERD